MDIFGSVGKGLSEADTFMRREMPFNMSWGFPAALVATYFAPQLLGSMGSAGGSSAGTSYGNLLGSMGLESGGFTGVPGQEGIFEISASQMTPEYLNLLAEQQGVSQGDPTFFQRLTQDTEQGLYNKLKDNISTQDIMRMVSQGNQPDQATQQLNQIKPQQLSTPRGTMKAGEAVDATSALLSLLASNQPTARVPRISLL